MSKTTCQVFDKVFKKVLTLSSTAVTNMINGLFGTDYPSDSTITYNWTEFHDGNLKHILADTIVTINGKDAYHMEAQMTKDDDIVFRVFEYSFGHADRTRFKDDDTYVLNFPEPQIIFLAESGNIPDEYVLTLDFGTQGTFEYKVPVFKFLEISTEELNRRKLVILIPFKLLKLRKLMAKKRSPENLEALKKLIRNDIIGSIDENLKVGNITPEDAGKLRRCTQILYNYIYSHYEEMEEVNEMTDESIMFDIDILEKNFEIAMAEKDKAMAEKDKAMAEQDKVIAEQDKVIAEQEKEMQKLREEIELLKKNNK